MCKISVSLFLCLLLFVFLPGKAYANSAGNSFQVAGDRLPLKDKKALVVVPGLTTEYSSVKTDDGVRLRVFLSYPEGQKKKKMSPLLFTQWVSCGSLVFNPRSGDRQILAELARKSGLAVVMVERAGTGDSEGPKCSDLDYDTELAHYVDAFSKILKTVDLDTSSVYVFGSSLGSTTAPLVAQKLQSKGYKIGGVAVQGGGGLTHFERMLNFDRNYLERRPSDVAVDTIYRQILNRTQFHTEYLIKGRHPDDVAKDNAAMAAVRKDVLGLSQKDHYGRPFQWHQQATQHNFQGAWAKINAPVLVIFNTFDQFETRRSHSVIVETVNRVRPGSAKMVEQEGIGHSHYSYPSIEAAYAYKDGKPAWQGTAGILVNWFRELRTKGSAD